MNDEPRGEPKFSDEEIATAREHVTRKVELTQGCVGSIEALAKRLDMSFSEALETFAFIGAQLFQASREAESLGRPGMTLILEI